MNTKKKSNPKTNIHMKQIELFPSTEIGTRDHIRANSKRGAEIIRIPLDKIVIIKNFNKRKRDNFGDIESLAKSILENGQIMPGLVDVLKNGTFAVVDGHRRVEAHFLCKEWGHETFFEAKVNHNKTTEVDRIFMMFLSQDNQPLTLMEQAELITDLMQKHHMTVDEIRQKLGGKTKQWIYGLLKLNGIEEDMKEQVESGKLAATSALAIQNAIPDREQRRAALERASKTAKDKGREKLLPKDVIRDTSSDAPQMGVVEKCQKIIKSLFDILALQSDPKLIEELRSNKTIISKMEHEISKII